MPTFGGVTGRVYYKAWHVPAPRAAAVIFLHGFGEHSGLYHRLGNALNNAGIELWALDEIGHGLTEGDRAVIRSIDDLVQNGRRLTALAEAVQPGRPVWLARHSLGSVAAACDTACAPSTSTAAPASCAASMTSRSGTIVPRALDTCAIATIRVRSVSSLRYSSRMIWPLSSTGTTRRVAPRSSASICHGTMLA